MQVGLTQSEFSLAGDRRGSQSSWKNKGDLTCLCGWKWSRHMRRGANLPKLLGEAPSDSQQGNRTPVLCSQRAEFCQYPECTWKQIAPQSSQNMAQLSPCYEACGTPSRDPATHCQTLDLQNHELINACLSFSHWAAREN